jgi:hypothetical protein
MLVVKRRKVGESGSTLNRILRTHTNAWVNLGSRGHRHRSKRGRKRSINWTKNWGRGDVPVGPVYPDMGLVREPEILVGAGWSLVGSLWHFSDNPLARWVAETIGLAGIELGLGHDLTLLVGDGDVGFHLFKTSQTGHLPCRAILLIGRHPLHSQPTGSVTLWFRRRKYRTCRQPS